MIIDYSRYPIAKFISVEEYDYGESFYCDFKEGITSGVKMFTPYGVKEDESKSKRRIFKKKSSNLVIDETKKGIGIRATHVQGGVQTIGLVRSSRGVDSIVSSRVHIDPDLLMPKLIVQPKNYEELKMLVLADPRFLKQVVPSKLLLDVKNSEQLIDFMRTMEQSVEDILYSQIELGVAWNKSEQEECEVYKETCIEAHKKFIQSLFKNVLKYRTIEEQNEAK